MLVNTVKYVPVAQLDRVSDSDSEGRRFESCRAYHVAADSALLQNSRFEKTAVFSSELHRCSFPN